MKFTATAFIRDNSYSAASKDIAIPSLEKLIRADIGHIAVILAEEMKPMLDTALQIVPVKTGALKASLRIEHETDGAVAYGYVLAGGGIVHYAKYVEAGPNPRPYLRPAFESNVAAVSDAAVKRIGEYLQGLTK